jgi:hypothetical protein
VKNLIVFIVLSSVVALAYQNCGGPIQDLEERTNASISDCPTSPAQAELADPSMVGSVYRFSIFSDLEVSRVKWMVQPGILDVTTDRPFLEQPFTTPGDYVMLALGMRDGCSTPVYSATRNFSVSNGSNVTCNTIMSLNVSNASVLVGATVTVSLNDSSSFNTSSISWTLNDVPKPEWNGLTSFSYNASTVGNMDFKAFAMANCGSVKNATIRLVVSAQATSPATLLDFKALPLFPEVTGPIRGSGTEAVYKILRSGTKTISTKFANTQSVTSEMAATSGCDPSHPNCYSLIVNASGCQYVEKTVIATGTNSAQNTLRFFAFCPSVGNYCHVGLLENRESNETCSGCGINLYIPQNGSSCQPVGIGYYSPENNNNRSQCTNTIPANAQYSGPGLNGTNNCPWACSAGYTQSGNSCVANNIRCQAITIGRCSFGPSDQGIVNGDCITRPGCMCRAFCNQNGILEIEDFRCPSENFLSCEDPR